MSDKYNIDDILAEVDKKRGDSPKSYESVTEIIGKITPESYIDESTRIEDENDSPAESAREEYPKHHESVTEIIDKITPETAHAEEIRAKTEETPEIEDKERADETFSAQESTRIFSRKDNEIPESKAASAADDDIVFHTKNDLVATETQQLRKLKRIEEINRALLAADKAAEEPDELVDSLNPMESREKAADELKNAEEKNKKELEFGDTLAVSGNDLKRISGGDSDKVKEYTPVTTRKKTSRRRG